MIIIKLKCDKKIRERFKYYGIDKRKLENFLMLHTNNLVKTRKWWNHEIKVKGIPGASSQYFWNEDEIEIALKCVDCSSKKQRRIYFLQSLVHEYRHWVQAQLQRVAEKKITYTEKDVEERNANYFKNKYEIECAEWEKIVESFNEFI
jgi:hypothetical protein